MSSPGDAPLAEEIPEPTPAPIAPPREPTRAELRRTEVRPEPEAIDPDEGDFAFDPALDSLDPLPAARHPTVGSRPAEKPAPAAPTPTPAPAPQKPRHPARVAAAARSLGFTQDEIDGLTTADLQREMDAVVAYTSQGRRPEAPRPEARPAEKPDAPSEPEVDFGPDFDEADYDPKFVGGFKKVFAAQAKQIADLRATVETLTRAEQARVGERAAETADRVFAERPELFGAGTFREADPASPEFARRNAVAAHVQFLKSQGRHTTLERDLRAAVAALFPGRAPKAAPAPEPEPAPAARKARPQDPETGHFLSDDQIEEEERRRAWMAGTTARPTERRDSPEPKGTRRAERAVADYMRRNGVGAAGHEPEENDFPE